MLAVLKVLKKLSKNINKKVDKVKIRCYYNTCSIKNVVIIAKRIHLFPFRTQKLSS